MLLNLIINPLLNNLIKSKILNELRTDSYSEASIDELNYSIITNQIELNNFIYTSADSSETNSLFIKAKSAVAGMNVLDYLLKGEYNFSSINIKGLEIKRFSENHSSNKDGKKNFSFSGIKGIHADEITIENGIYIHKHLSSNLNDSIKNFSISVKDLVIDSSSNVNGILSSSANTELNAEYIQIYFTDILYKLSLNDLKISSNQMEASAKEVSLRPYLNDADFFAGKRFRADRFITGVKAFHCEEIDINKLLADKIFSVGKITLDGFLFDALTNMRFPENLYAAPPVMPNEAVNSLPFFLNIKKADLLNGKIYVKELYPYAENPAVLLFQNVNANASNIVTGETAQINIGALLMGKGKLDVIFNIDLNPEEFKFSYNGTLDSMNAVELNSFIKIANRVEVSSGQIHHIDYNVTAQSDSAYAESTPVYSGLKIKNLNEETGSSSGIAELVSSAIANIFVIKGDNGIGEKPESSGILYVKKNDDAFMEYVWISLRKSLGKIVGFN